jgi:predicted O-methyltransferase YrrM
VIDLLKQIEKLAGWQRHATFRKAAEFILDNNCQQMVETGCYRGTYQDGQSTLILALLAKALNYGMVTSFDNNPDHIKLARELLVQHEVLPWWNSECTDSVHGLSRRKQWVDFAYLDSLDHNPKDPLPCQAHQLAEVGAVIGKMHGPCAILMDDNDVETGGKVAQSVPFLKRNGWKVVAEEYQILMVKEKE